ncbi:MAG: glutathione S-transferase N-terminal domain-containing protein [Gammaproteobacteria bacterium]
MKLKLYYARNSGSFVARIIIHELNLPCDFIAVTQKTLMTELNENFLKINPKGRLPVLVTENGEIITENQVILQYLVDTYAAQREMQSLLPSLNDHTRYKILEWASFIRIDLHYNFYLLHNSDIPAELKEKLKYPESMLNNKQYLVDNFSIADAYLFVILVWLKDVKIDIAEYPNLAKYYLLLNERPSIKLSLKEKNMQ